ncbi:MAG: hypothetical protein SNJ70_06650 [Armatimonadota bacterium]
MTRLDGVPRFDGVAIAIAIKVDGPNAISKISKDILNNGVKALKAGLQKKDYPEVIVICQDLCYGYNFKIPGINVIGIAAEEDDIDIDVDIPCVTEVKHLMININEKDIVVVDGTRGIVYPDPDPHTLIFYQEIQSASRPHVYCIGEEHIIAQTVSGEKINVYAIANNLKELEEAVCSGADALILDIREKDVDDDKYNDIMKYSAGKPIVFIIDNLSEALLEAFVRFAEPNQVTLIYKESDEWESDDSIESAMLDISRNVVLNDRNPQVIYGKYISSEDELRNSVGTQRVILDIVKVLGNKIDVDRFSEQFGWVFVEDNFNDAIIVVDKKLNIIPELVDSGAKSIAVSYKNVKISKEIICSIGV